VPTLKFKFPGGRYHATPWGHHVNEGLIEWPPSPWRILRSLIATGFSCHHWPEIPEVAKELLIKLAGTMPSYCLPEVSIAHSRHFMPTGVLSKGREKPTLVFDTWANVGSGTLFIYWDCKLSHEEAQQLTDLAATLNYLGRSESWVEVEAIPDNPSLEFNSFPHKQGVHAGPDWEQLSLMAPIPADLYTHWHRETSEKILAEYPLPKGKKKQTGEIQKDRDKAVAPYPPDLMSCLTKDTAWWKQHGWSQPPGSQRVLYWRRSDLLQVGPPPHSKKQPVASITTMLLTLTTPSGNRSALPPCTRTLPQAELFHRAIVARAGRGNRIDCPELTGKDIHGKPLHDHHEHAHTLPVDLDGDGHLDHLIVYAKMGLNGDAQHAIRTLKRTWTKGSSGDIQLALAGYGDLNILRKLPQSLVSSIDSLLGTSSGSLVWESATPFVPPRFLKKSGKNNILGQINAELVSRNLPEVASLEVLPLADIKKPLRHFVCRRNHGGSPPPVDMGYGLRLTFSEPISGPLLLGYASHYGLGMFHAVTK